MESHDDVSPVVREFRRTRRNRFVLTSAASVFVILPSFSSDSVGLSHFAVVPLVILLYTYYRVFKSEQREEQDTGSFPSVADDLQLLKEDRNLPEVVGYRVMPDGWLIKNTLLTFDFFRASEICWVYRTRTKHYVNFVPTGTTHGILIGLKSGRILQAKHGRDRVTADLNLLLRIAPWAVFGYSKELSKLWERSREAFVAQVEKRAQAAMGSAGGRPDSHGL